MRKLILLLAVLGTTTTAAFATPLASIKASEPGHYTVYSDGKALWDCTYSHSASLTSGSTCEQLSKPYGKYELNEKTRRLGLASNKLVLSNDHSYDTNCEFTYANYLGHDLYNTKSGDELKFSSNNGQLIMQAVNTDGSQITFSANPKSNDDGQIDTYSFNIKNPRFAEALLPFINELGKKAQSKSNRRVSADAVKNNYIESSNTYKITFNEQGGGKFIAHSEHEGQYLPKYVIFYGDSKSENGTQIVSARNSKDLMRVKKQNVSSDTLGGKETRYLFERPTEINNSFFFKEMTTDFTLLDINAHSKTLAPFATSRKCTKSNAKRIGIGLDNTLFAIIEIYGQGSSYGEFKDAYLKITQKGQEYLESKNEDIEAFTQMLLLLTANNIGKYMSSVKTWATIETTSKAVAVTAATAVVITAAIAIATANDGNEYNQGYNNGYDDGYNDGYDDGWWDSQSDNRVESSSSTWSSALTSNKNEEWYCY